MRPQVFTLFLLLVLSVWQTNGQSVQWASKVDAFSSEYGTSDYSAKQALGVPNAMNDRSLSHMAWVPKKEESNLTEFIKVSFENAAYIQQVAIVESKNPGAIYRITLYDTKGGKHKVYENKNPRGTLQPFRLFRHTFPRTAYKVKSLKVELKTKAVKGSNQIDAIAISTSRSPIKVEINQMQYAGPVSKPERLSNNVNSNFAERLPIISPDGQTLYFARKYHPQNMGEENYDDIWVSYRQADGSWSRASNVGGPLNNADHNFVVAMDPSGQLLYLANDYKSRNKDGISISEKQGRTWTRPRALKIEDHYNENKFVSYHVSADGQVLLMSVERKSGMGDRDLYVSFKTGINSFSKPMNLGARINTIGVESSVFLAADGKTIYFSSNGHEGYGGLDMFMSKRLDDSWRNWSTPKNLGPRINTKGNEYNYTIPASGDYAYFSVDEANNMSALYRIRLPEEVRPDPVMLISGRIINAETNRPISANLKYKELNNNKDETSSSTDDGRFKIILPYGENIGVYAETEGYISVSENMALAGNNLEELDYEDEDLTAQLGGSNDASEVEELKLRLEKVNKDLDYLKSKRERANQKKKSRKGYTGTRATDPELEALKHRYNSTQRDKADTKEKSKQAVTSSSSTEDKELAALKAKYNKHNQQTSTAKETKPTTKSKRNKTEDDELAEMRRRYNKHFGLNTDEEEEEEVIPVQEELDGDFDFERFGSLVKMEMEMEMEPIVKLELLDQLFSEVIRDMQNSDAYKDAPPITASIRSRVKRQLIEFFDSQSSASPNTDLRVMRREYRARDLEAMEKDIRRTLKPGLKADLREFFREDVRLAIESEMAFELKQVQEEELRREIEERLDDQNRNPIPLASANRRSELPEEVPSQPEYQELEKDILMIPIEVGQTIPMNNIFFDSNKSTLKEESKAELERIIDFLRRYSNLIVEVGGHTNGWCSHSFANKLSTERSKVVAEYFQSNGIPKSKITYRGYGKTAPVASNDSAQGRRQNQRVELKILEILN